MTIPIFGLKP